MDQLPDTLTCGYHGTSDVHAAAIMRDGFRPSAFEGDWLGSVAYFFNDQDRAAQWALRTVHRDGGNPIVCTKNGRSNLATTLARGHRFSIAHEYWHIVTHVRVGTGRECGPAEKGEQVSAVGLAAD